MTEYQIVREIGEGTTARVYEAKDRDGRTVALKIFPPDTRTLMWAGQEEARLLTGLTHPNILKIEKFLKEVPPMLVMEFIEGCSLQARVENKGLLYSRDALHLLLNLAEATQYLHSKGVNHGDLRPKNILLRKEDPKSPVICDFGLSSGGSKEGDAASLLSLFRYAAGDHPFINHIKTPTIAGLIRETKRALSASPISSRLENRSGCLGIFSIF